MRSDFSLNLYVPSCYINLDQSLLNIACPLQLSARYSQRYIRSQSLRYAMIHCENIMQILMVENPKFKGFITMMLQS